MRKIAVGLTVVMLAAVALPMESVLAFDTAALTGNYTSLAPESVQAFVLENVEIRLATNKKSTPPLSPSPSQPNSGQCPGFLHTHKNCHRAVYNYHSQCICID